MRKHGIVVHLSVTPRVLAKRLEGNCDNRPLLANVKSNDLEELSEGNFWLDPSYSGANTKWEEEEYSEELIDAKLESIGWRLRGPIITSL